MNMFGKHGVLNNPITAGILIAIGVLFLIGVGLVFSGSLWGVFWGVLLVFIAFAMIGSGYKEHGLITQKVGKDEVTVSTFGLIEFMDVPVEIGGEYVVINSAAILAPWLGIKSTLIDMTKKQMEFTVPVVTSDNLNGKVKVTIIAGPSHDDLFDYIQYGGGKLEPVERDLSGSVSQETENAAATMNMVELCKNKNKLAARLEVLKDNCFGLDIIQIKVECELPADLAKSYTELRQAEVDAEKLVIQTLAFNKAVNALAQSAKDDHGQPISYEEATKRVQTQRMIADKKIVRIQTEDISVAGAGGGNRRSVTVINPQFGP